MSFGLAARRLGADTLDFSPGGSSPPRASRSSTPPRTSRRWASTRSSSGTPRRGPAPARPAPQGRGVVNAGDGAHEHPTQGLLDIFTIRQRQGRVEGLTVGLVGDIAHSRVARTNIHGLTKLGAKVIVCGPPTLVPPEVGRLGVEIAHNLDDILPRCDVLNLLRVQFERQRSGLFPSVREYARLFGMDGDRMRKAKPDVLLLAPGPINRGVEITPGRGRRPELGDPRPGDERPGGADGGAGAGVRAMSAAERRKPVAHDVSRGSSSGPTAIAVGYWLTPLRG